MAPSLSRSTQQAAVLINLSSPLSSHLTFSSLVVGPVIVIGLQFFCYGIYCMLFTTCLALLKRSGQTSGARTGTESRPNQIPIARPKETGLQRQSTVFHLFTLTSLFVLASISVVFETGRILHDTAYYFSFATNNEELRNAVTSGSSSAGKQLEFAMNGIAGVIYLVGNVIADMILLLRLYVIWGRQWSVVIGPLIACTLSNLYGIATTVLVVAKGPKTLDTATGKQQFWFNLSQLLQGIYLVINLITTLILIGLVAGRLWWLSRGSLNASNRRRYNTIAAIILESGLIYPLVIIPSIVFSTISSLAGWDLAPLLIQAAGIAPTVMIVRCQKGISIENDRTVGTTYGSGAQSSLAFGSVTAVSSNSDAQTRGGVNTNLVELREYPSPGSTK